jgi:hypothetical protein
VLLSPQTIKKGAGYIHPSVNLPRSPNQMNKHLHLTVQALITVEPGAFRIVVGFITGSKAKTLVYVFTK